jgi:hypothetical protein
LKAELATHAEADGTHSAGAAFVGSEVIASGGDVVEGRALAAEHRPHRADHAERLPAALVQGGRDGQVPGRGEAVDDPSEVRGQTECVLNDDHTGPRAGARRHRNIGGQRPAGAGVGDVRHEFAFEISSWSSRVFEIGVGTGCRIG